MDNFLDFLEQQEPELVATALAIAATDSDEAAMQELNVDAAEFSRRRDRIEVVRKAFLHHRPVPPAILEPSTDEN